MNDMLVNFDEISEKQVKIVGGKAANLAKMAQVGLPVPAGFVVTLEAFDGTGKLKTEVAPEIAKLLDGGKLYAVRSSALAEDSADESWAGQFESFLDTKSSDVIQQIETCHNSAKTRAKAYSADSKTKFEIAVVVQEMLKPDYAGVLFTRDPVDGSKNFVVEYVEGLGEELVSGRADPVRLSWIPGDNVDTPFDIRKLSELAQKITTVFGQDQDIEWAEADGKIWLLQTRPITAVQSTGDGFNLGEPEDLFYWGPARTKPMYISDWLTANEQVFIAMTKDPKLPSPPKTLGLFWDDKVVFLLNAKSFQLWAEKSFQAYRQLNQLEDDRAQWQKTAETLSRLQGEELTQALVQAWSQTIFAEFSLYGAEYTVAKQLDRFDSPTRQDIWGAFTVPGGGTFLNRIDNELLASQNPPAMAAKHPWIQDGYDGVRDDAEDYFVGRLKLLKQDSAPRTEAKKDKAKMIKNLGLTDDEVKTLDLTRKLAQFMDDRKAWMMKTRRLIKQSANGIEFGWFFNDGKSASMSAENSQELWQRYVNFRASTNAVKGVVASNGGRHFISGEVTVIASPADSVASGKILVVPSTSPSYVPLMRTAKALITDHGGMMSHAAIVAREFNLPCIVGTKSATQILKTGDQVVLDLIKGEVNK